MDDLKERIISRLEKVTAEAEEETARAKAEYRRSITNIRKKLAIKGIPKEAWPVGWTLMTKTKTARVLRRNEQYCTWLRHQTEQVKSLMTKEQNPFSPDKIGIHLRTFWTMCEDQNVSLPRLITENDLKNIGKNIENHGMFSALERVFLEVNDILEHRNREMLF